MSRTLSRLSLSLFLPVLVPAQEASHAESHDPLHLDKFVVTASGFARSQADLAQATTVLDGDALAHRQTPTLGETLAGLPGVSSTWFGAGSSRPLIRGLGGDRVRILENQVGTLDASVASPDHAVSIEPFLVERVEVVRGPASLLYGGSAVGGVVNVITHRIDEELPPGRVSGRLDARGGTGADERAAGGVLSVVNRTGADTGVVLHLDGFRRRTGDVRIPGFAESSAVRAEETAHALAVGDPAPDFARGVLPNSSVDTSGGAAGFSWVGPEGHAGLAYSGLDTLYGVPGHAHGAAGGGVKIDLRQRRLDFQAETKESSGPWAGARLKVGRADYSHRELEDGQVGTVFANQGWEARAELLHSDLAGLAGTWGAQAGRSDLEVTGDEAFLPRGRTTSRALFAFEELRSGTRSLEFGARHEWQEITLRDGSGRSRSDRGLAWSVGGVWHPDPRWTLAVTAVRTQRAPNAQELYADGPHAGTGAYEIGDAALAREGSLGLEASVRRREGRVTGELTVFVNRFRGFIYEQDTGRVATEQPAGFVLADPALLTPDELEAALPAYRYAQTDARLHGAEAEVVVHLHEAPGRRLDLRVTADVTRARDGDGRPLPRIPAARTTLALEGARGPVGGGLEWQWTAAQRRTAPGESASDGYGMLNAHLAWRINRGADAWELFLRVSNLTDAEARPHTSFLKELAPLPGRNVSAGVRWDF